MPRRHEQGSTEDLPAPAPRCEPANRPAPQVSLLAATALGFAYAPGRSTESLAVTLVALAEPHPETLHDARIAVQSVEIASADAREQAAQLLRTAEELRGRRPGPLSAGGPPELMVPTT